jgi:two-component system cell cycle response regulator CpdR
MLRILFWPVSATSDSQMPRILLAEDDDSLRGFLARALERAGYEVTACADGDEAAAVLDQAWDLLLTDIVMPGLDGIEVARQAAARHPGLRIMFITGFAAVALAAGENAPAGAKVLSKPIHLREIVNEVDRMIAA